MMRTLAAAALLAAAPLARADPLPQVLQATISGALSEIMLGQLAGRTSDSPDVRAFGRALAEDETAIELKAIDLAGAMGVAQPTQATDAGRQEYARLQGLSGRDFDRAFLSQATAGLRNEMAALKPVASGPPGPGSAFAKDAVARLEKRLQAAEALHGGG